MKKEEDIDFEREREREREEGCVLVMEGCGGRRRGGWREVRGGSCFLLFSFYLMTTVVADDAFLFSYDFYGTFFLMLFFFFPGISGSYALRVSVVLCCKCGLCYTLHLHYNKI